MRQAQIRTVRYVYPERVTLSTIIFLFCKLSSYAASASGAREGCRQFGDTILARIDRMTERGAPPHPDAARIAIFSGL